MYLLYFTVCITHMHAFHSQTYGGTALHFAAAGGYSKCVQILIQNGASANSQSMVSSDQCT